MFLDDEFGDVIEVTTMEDHTVEMSILSGDLTKQVTTGMAPDGTPIREGLYVGGFVLDRENIKRLHRFLGEWVNKV